jgi:hypothetical protein
MADMAGKMSYVLGVLETHAKRITAGHPNRETYRAIKQYYNLKRQGTLHMAANRKVKRDTGVNLNKVDFGQYVVQDPGVRLVPRPEWD